MGRLHGGIVVGMLGCFLWIFLPGIAVGQWYSRGTLHHASGLAWQQADARNRLATAADMVAAVVKEGGTTHYLQHRRRLPTLCRTACGLHHRGNTDESGCDVTSAGHCGAVCDITAMAGQIRGAHRREPQVSLASREQGRETPVRCYAKRQQSTR